MRPMRKNSIITEKMLSVNVLRYPGFLPFDHFDGSTWRGARDSQPYRVGDIIKWWHSGKECVMSGLIVAIAAEYLDRKGEFIPMYRVRPHKKNGELSRTYCNVYPGYIDKAEEKELT